MVQTAKDICSCPESNRNGIIGAGAMLKDWWDARSGLSVDFARQPAGRQCVHTALRTRSPYPIHPVPDSSMPFQRKEHAFPSIGCN